jgi:hypothetical protein
MSEPSISHRLEAVKTPARSPMTTPEWQAAMRECEAPEEFRCGAALLRDVYTRTGSESALRDAEELEATADRIDAKYRALREELRAARFPRLEASGDD